MSVELKVVLVGEDQEQQSAFNNPSPVPSTGPSIPPVQPATLPSPPPVQTSANRVTGGSQQEPPQPQIQSTEPSSQSALSPPPIPAWHVQAPPVQWQEQRLIDSIEELIESIDALTGISTQQRNPRSQPATQPGQPTQASTGNFFERFARTIDRKIDDLGLAHTSVGNMVSNLTNMVAGAGSRVTKAASSFVEPVVSKAASLAGRTAATAGTAEVAGGAAAASGATTGVATAAGAAALPLVAMAAVAAASALSLKMFMDAVERAAGELEDLSPQIAGVRAQHEVTMELARLDRAKRIGGDVANLDHARHRITESMYEVQTKIYELVLKGSPILERVLDALNVLIRTVDVGVATTNSAIATLTPDPTDDQPAAKALAEASIELANVIVEFRNDQHHHANHGRDPIFDELLGIGQANKPKAPRKGNGLGGGL